MKNKEHTAITPTRKENYSQWYQAVIRSADLAEVSSVRGCMIIKPWGYAIWENIQKVLDNMFKATGHLNVYFPLFIPKSYLENEEEHLDGFAKECAIVTHTSLKKSSMGGLEIASPLKEPLIIRPTSETIVGKTFSQWIHSYRDLPILINQWANVVRWEMRTRLFLRTTEFLWQEGHTAHATAKEAVEESNNMLNLYANFCKNYMAMPVIKGKKTVAERFPGAVDTFCIEAMMQDRKAMQSATSHFMGQNFAKAFKITYLDQLERNNYAWTTSWGCSTRLIGGLIMTHSDDNGLCLPPKLSPFHIVILPILHTENMRSQVLQYCDMLKQELNNQLFSGEYLRINIDKRDLRGGEKMWQWIKKGIPLWIEVGPRDIQQNSLLIGRRDQNLKNRFRINYEIFIKKASKILESIQDTMYQRALFFRKKHTIDINNKKDFYDFFTSLNNKESSNQGGFVSAYWCENQEIENKIKKELKISIRCIPQENSYQKGKCIITGKENSKKVIFAKSY